MRKISTVLMLAGVIALGMALTACSPAPGSGKDGDGTGDETTTTTTTGDDATTTGDTDDTTVDGTTSSDETTCVPFCQPGWECGPDGCGDVCGGGCTGGCAEPCPGDAPCSLECNNAKHVCEETCEAPPLEPLGGPCGRQGECQPFVNTPNGFEENPNWPQCINAKCESGQCFEPACSRPCTITKDQVDHAGSAGPDGVDDPDAAFDDCAGAKDGPLGTEYTCVAFAPPDQGQPVNFCVPGTTFAPCVNNTDCPANETCQLQYILGEYSTRCGSAPKGSVEIGGFCNRNPEEGEVAYCETTLCFGPGCIGFCGDDSDCLTDSCSGGKCGKTGADCAGDAECSALYCYQQFEVFGQSNPDIKFDICWGNVCTGNTDCPGDDYFCRINFNGENNENAAWEHLCAAAAPNAAKLGEECEDDSTDNIPKPPCAGPCLNNGICSAICEADADCAGGGPSMKCNANAVPVDFNNDEIDDTYIALGLCVDYPGSQTDCQSDGDCAGAATPEACDFYPYLLADGAIDAKGICVETEPGQGDVGDACGGNSGVTCKSGFCLGTQGDQPGFCTALCGSKADCPAGPTTLGLFTGNYNMFCFGYLYSNGFDDTSNEDMVFVPLCRPAVAETSPLTDCSGDFKCGPNEACQAIAIASGSTGPTNLEYLCMGAGIFDAQGAFQASTGKLGSSCDILFESMDPGDFCESNYCLPDAGDDEGYCGALCTTNADCSAAGMVCDEMVLIDRKGADNDVSTKVCRKEASCIPCQVDTDCTGEYVCVNVGSVGLLEERRCAPPCTVDTDCNGTDGGNSCVESNDGAGKPEGVSSCEPTC